MVFNSFSFLIFCPIVFALYWLIADRYKWIILLIASCYFYMSWNVKYIVLILITTLASYLCGIGVESTEDKKRKKLYIALTMIISLGILFVFKYLDFAFNTVNKILSKVSISLSPLTLKLLLPVGISFYTFQTLSYVIDVYRGDIKAEHHFGKYATFVSFFPQLVAGPIERASNLLPQINNPKKFDYDVAAYGVRQMLLGFFKKMVIADNLALLVDYVHAYIPSSGPHLWMAVIGFTIQIYCDFSGYSDIAIGTAKLFNINLIQNFKSPYFATSVKDFWRRWHISLSNWFRDYVYIPLGGNRCGFIRNRVNVMIVFLLSGLWHGADWHFVIWGGLHGALQLFGGKKKQEEKHNFLWIIKVIITFFIINLTWIFFRTGIGNSLHIIRELFRPGCTFAESISYITAGTILTNFKLIFILVSIILLGIYDYFSLKNDILRKMDEIVWPVRLIIYFIMIALIMIGMPFVVSSQFIYFQF